MYEVHQCQHIKAKKVWRMVLSYFTAFDREMKDLQQFWQNQQHQHVMVTIITLSSHKTPRLWSKIFTKYLPNPPRLTSQTRHSRHVHVPVECWCFYSYATVHLGSLDVDSWEGALDTDVPSQPLWRWGPGCTCICSRSVPVLLQRLLFFLSLLFLLIIARPQSADHHSFIPQILLCDSRLFMAVSCCLQEPLLHKCQVVKFNISCTFQFFFLMFFTSNLPKL